MSYMELRMTLKVLKRSGTGQRGSKEREQICAAGGGEQRT